MPEVVRATSGAGAIRKNRDRLDRQMRRPSGGGFDPNENPVIIGADSSAGGGSTPDSVAGGFASAVAIGDGANATDDRGVAVGQFAEGAADSVAIGPSAWATNQSCVSIGDSSQATAASGVAIGVNARATGSIGTAVGAGAHATASATTALGDAATASHANSTAIGKLAASDRTNQVMLGHGEVVDIYGAGNGLALRSPDGTRWVITVDDTGHLTTTAVP